MFLDRKLTKVLHGDEAFLPICGADMRRASSFVDQDNGISTLEFRDYGTSGVVPGMEINASRQSTLQNAWSALRMSERRE
jgi:hypothetical protein